MIKTLLAAVILVGISAQAQAQARSTPLVVTATVVSTCQVSVPDEIEHSAFSTLPVGVACTRGKLNAQVRHPLAPRIAGGHALVVINF
jgi:hypothetical protein